MCTSGALARRPQFTAQRTQLLLVAGFRLLVMLIFAAVAGCASTELPFSFSKIPTLDEAPAEPQVKSDASPDGPAKYPEFDLDGALEPTPITIQKNDTLKVTLWGYPELDHIAAVQPNGMITLPLVGEVPVEGLSVEQIRNGITTRLEPFTTISDSDLRVGDALTMSVWQQSELFHTSVIAPDGTVTFPLVGQLQAVGRSVEDIRIEAEERMVAFMVGAQVSILPEWRNRRMLFDPRVSVLTQNLQPREVAVIGAVGLQGVQQINGSLTIVEALARSSVDRRIAALNSVVVIRDSKGEAPSYRRLLLSDYFAGNADNQNIYLQDGDIVIVPKTIISRVGDFVDLFFQRTGPMFAWWSGLQAATVATDSADTVELINESLEQQLIDLNVNP